MYSVVLMMALTGSAETTEFGRRGCNACHNGCSTSCSVVVNGCSTGCSVVVNGCSTYNGCCSSYCHGCNGCNGGGLFSRLFGKKRCHGCSGCYTTHGCSGTVIIGCSTGCSN